MTDLFDRFWLSGIRKMDKKKARRAFDKVTKVQPNPEAFVDMVIFDVQKRIEIKQLGFDRMYPATYLNGERWEDEIPEVITAMDRLADRSWAAGIDIEQTLLN